MISNYLVKNTPPTKTGLLKSQRKHESVCWDLRFSQIPLCRRRASQFFPRNLFLFESNGRANSQMDTASGRKQCERSTILGLTGKTTNKRTKQQSNGQIKISNEQTDRAQCCLTLR